jgi:hypothetical protein
MDPSVVQIEYTNWRGEFGVRRIQPRSIRFGVSEWHKEPQWLLLAWDIDKKEDREFAFKDITHGNVLVKLVKNSLKETRWSGQPVLFAKMESPFAVVLMRQMAEEVAIAAGLQPERRFYLEGKGANRVDLGDTTGIKTIFLFGSYYSREFVKECAEKAATVMLVATQEDMAKYDDCGVDHWNAWTKHASCEEFMHGNGFTEFIDYALQRYKNDGPDLSRAQAVIEGFRFECGDDADPVGWLMTKGASDETLAKWEYIGNTLREYKLQMAQLRIKNGIPFTFEGYTALACDCPDAIMVQKDALAKLPEYQVGITFCLLPRPAGYQVGLVSCKPGIDVGELARKHGGGGSKTNSGFFLPLALAHEVLPFLKA